MLRYKNQLLVLGIHVALLLLLFSSYRKPAIWDEDIFRNNCFLFNQMGFSKAFLRAMVVQAPGPLYQFVHFIFFPLTGYALFKMRLVNFFVFILAEIVAYRAFGILVKRTAIDERLSNILAVLAFPGFFVTAIFCMSEAPTYFILACVLYFIISGETDKYMLRNRLVHYILQGILMGLLIIGRTQFLVIPFVYFAAACYTRPRFRNLGYPFLSVVIALLLSAPLFVIWGGLVPPRVAALEAGLDKLNYRNMFIAMGYFVFIQYGLLRNRIPMTRKEWIAAGICMVLLILVNQYLFHIQYDSSSLHFLPRTLMFSLVAAFTLLALYVAAKDGIAMLLAKNIIAMFCYASALLVLLSMIKMSNYNVGVRHIGQVALLLVLTGLCFRPKPIYAYKYQYGVLLLFIALNFMVVLNQLFHFPTLLH